MIRLYKDTDKDILVRMLKDEGLKEEDIKFQKHKTYIYEDGKVKGFFTFRYEHDMPHLIHFCLDKKCRDFSTAVALTREFVRQIKRENYKEAIVHAPHNKAYLNTLIRYFFRVKPYKVDDDYSFYLVEV